MSLTYTQALQHVHDSMHLEFACRSCCPMNALNNASELPVLTEPVN